MFFKQYLNSKTVKRFCTVFFILFYAMVGIKNKTYPVFNTTKCLIILNFVLKRENKALKVL